VISAEHLIHAEPISRPQEILVSADALPAPSTDTCIACLPHCGGKVACSNAPGVTTITSAPETCPMIGRDANAPTAGCRQTFSDSMQTPCNAGFQEQAVTPLWLLAIFLLVPLVFVASHGQSVCIHTIRPCYHLGWWLYNTAVGYKADCRLQGTIEVNKLSHKGTIEADELSHTTGLRRVKHRRVGKSPWDAGHVVAARSGSATGGMTTKSDPC
jgi:hypothetical protein